MYHSDFFHMKNFRLIVKIMYVVLDAKKNYYCNMNCCLHVNDEIWVGH